MVLLLARVPSRGALCQAARGAKYLCDGASLLGGRLLGHAGGLRGLGGGRGLLGLGGGLASDSRRRVDGLEDARARVAGLGAGAFASHFVMGVWVLRREEEGIVCARGGQLDGWLWGLF